MANVVYAVNVRSTYPARTVAAFPDVCKTPSPTAPVPIPYPNAAAASSTNANAVKSKQMRAHYRTVTD